MLSGLNIYKLNGRFEYGCKDDLRIECKAPKNQGGVYLVYNQDKIEELLYIGSSGWVNQDGSFGLRKNGMYERIVNGKQSFIIDGIITENKRRFIWPMKMLENKIDKIRIEWFVTFTDSLKHIPSYVEAAMIQQYFEKCNSLPKWNISF